MNETEELTESLKNMGQTLSILAASCGAYFTALLNAGVPIDLAHKLVLDWHREYWMQVLIRGNRKDE